MSQMWFRPRESPFEHLSSLWSERTRASWRRLALLLVGLFIAYGSLAVHAPVSGSTSASKSQLVYAGDVPQAPILSVSIQKSHHLFHITLAPRFRNTGVGPAHIGRVSVIPVGLDQVPHQIRIVYLDRSEIPVRDEKEIRCQFLLIMDSITAVQQKSLEFRAVFYDDQDYEVYWEGIFIENIPRPTAPRPTRTL